ncbi:MAG: hypothetical protein Tsb005_11820 [Gammaproteobacteria bacterium]
MKADSQNYGHTDYKILLQEYANEALSLDELVKTADLQEWDIKQWEKLLTLESITPSVKIELAQYSVTASLDKLESIELKKIWIEKIITIALDGSWKPLDAWKIIQVIPENLDISKFKFNPEIFKNYLNQDSEKINLKICLLLIEYNFFSAKITDKNGNTLLHITALRNQSIFPSSYFGAFWLAGVTDNIKNMQGLTALQIAMDRKVVLFDDIKALINQCCEDPNQKNSFEQNLLMIALEQGWDETQIEYILSLDISIDFETRKLNQLSDDKLIFELILEEYLTEKCRNTIHIYLAKKRTEQTTIITPVMLKKYQFERWQEQWTNTQKKLNKFLRKSINNNNPNDKKHIECFQKMITDHDAKIDLDDLKISISLYMEQQRLANQKELPQVSANIQDTFEQVIIMILDAKKFQVILEPSESKKTEEQNIHQANQFISAKNHINNNQNSGIYKSTPSKKEFLSTGESNLTTTQTLTLHSIFKTALLETQPTQPPQPPTTNNLLHMSPPN